MVGKETLIFLWYSKTTYNLGQNSISKWLIICDRLEYLLWHLKKGVRM